MVQVTDSHCTHFEVELHFILSSQHVHGNSVTYLSFQALFAHITISDNSENIKNIFNAYVLNVNNKVYVIISSGNLKRRKDASIEHLDISTFACVTAVLSEWLKLMSQQVIKPLFLLLSVDVSLNDF